MVKLSGSTSKHTSTPPNTLQAYTHSHPHTHTHTKQIWGVSYLTACTSFYVIYFVKFSLIIYLNLSLFFSSIGKFGVLKDEVRKIYSQFKKDKQAKTLSYNEEQIHKMDK